MSFHGFGGAAAAIILGAIGGVTVANPATAAIRCHNGYQIVGGNEIATPYCQDENLAHVAREFGIKTTGARIRADWGHKRDICRLIGQDIRIQSACIGEDDRGDSGGPFD